MHAPATNLAPGGRSFSDAIHERGQPFSPAITLQVGRCGSGSAVYGRCFRRRLRRSGLSVIVLNDLAVEAGKQTLNSAPFSSVFFPESPSRRGADAADYAEMRVFVIGSRKKGNSVPRLVH